MRKVVIIGGGLAGLISSIQLIRSGIPSTVIEKKSYPLHRVCGEYVSNEALPFLKSSGLLPRDVVLPQINNFEVSTPGGYRSSMTLEMGGFGISRHTFDHHLFSIAKQEGVEFQLQTEATGIEFSGEGFEVETTRGPLHAELVIGSFGKRSRLDVQMGRSFMAARSPYVGVKYHVKSGHPENLVSLHNFKGGYCGVCRVDGGLTNLCYLTHRDNLKRYGDIGTMEKEVLFRNPFLRRCFLDSEFVFNKPEVINEISFATKEPVDNHVLMAGDAAGMIAPVCGNGMAMAIHGGWLLSGMVEAYFKGHRDRTVLEQSYAGEWNALFRSRLRFGRNVQRLFGHPRLSPLAAGLIRMARPLARTIVERTHGRPFG